MTLPIRLSLALVALTAGASAIRPGKAQVPEQPGQISAQPPSSPAPAPGIWSRDTLGGDWAGLRPILSDRGVTFTLNYAGEVLGNVSGGLKRGAIYEQQVLGTVEADLGKLLSWNGATAHVSAYDIAGGALTRGYVNNLLTISSIEAPPDSVRLYTLWLSQKLMSDRITLKAGVLALDEEGWTLTGPGALFVNSTFGPPVGMLLDMPAGGPFYPLSAPGALVDFKATPILDLHAAVMSGDPSGGNGTTNPIESTPYGTVISFSGGVLIAAEAVLNPYPDQKGGVTRFKLGGWYHTGNHFGDQQFDTAGISLASSFSNGMPRNHVGDWAIYGTAEGMLYRVPATDDQGLAGFARAFGMPEAQRNLVSVYADGGLTYKGLLRSRPHDTAGVAVAYLGISSGAQGLDRDTAFFTGNPAFPIRNHEILLELTYQIEIVPWWHVQPNLQYVINPGGGILDPVNPTKKLGNATILGLRTSVAF